MQAAAPAKINLFLHVTAKRADGYHLLQSLAVFTPPIADTLSYTPADTLSLRITGPFARALAQEDTASNLVLRAARALQAHANIPHGAALTLEKRLPIASGIGGGSADAAAALRLLSQAWNIALPPAKLEALALTLGSDVPMCLRSTPCWVEGVGEQLTPLNLPFPLPLVLVNPGVPLSSADAYRGVQPPYRAPLMPQSWPDVPALAQWLHTHTQNDLQPGAIAKVPIITQMLAALTDRPGCLLARMSGSGATCFGLFANGEQATQAALEISLRQPQWWVRV